MIRNDGKTLSRAPSPKALIVGCRLDLSGIKSWVGIRSAKPLGDTVMSLETPISQSSASCLIQVRPDPDGQFTAVV